MNLLLDAGNTRLKWGLHSGSAWLARGVLDYPQLDRLADCWSGFGEPEYALGSNVAGERIAARIGEVLADCMPLVWNRPQVRQCGVSNGYRNPGQLGADRWAALIGARQLHRGAALVVMAGTATTIDLLTGDGRFLGGVILPGVELMRRSLASDTADLPLAEGCYERLPCRTEDAIVSGCLESQAGAVERLFARLDAGSAPVCLLGGGAAGAIEGLLRIPLRRVDNLVLEGLAVIAGGTG